LTAKRALLCDGASSISRGVNKTVSADLILDQNHRFQFASQRVPTLWI
jgi:hypothetical protein